MEDETQREGCIHLNTRRTTPKAKESCTLNPEKPRKKGLMQMFSTLYCIVFLETLFPSFQKYHKISTSFSVNKNDFNCQYTILVLG